MSCRLALVTGAAGFIGSHVVEELVAHGTPVRALVHYNSRDDLGWLSELSPETLQHVEIVRGDVADAHQMRLAVEGADAVFHLAALIGIPYSYVAPSAYVDTNVRGTLNLLEAARSAGVERFVQTSTSEVYGSAQYLPIDEDHPLHAQSPYAATKVGADQLALSYHRSFALPVVVVRPFNTYGPRQSTRAIVPTILTQLLSGSGPVRLGSLDTRRDLSFVRDTAAGFRAVGESEVAGTVLNLGTGVDHSIQEVFDLACRVTGREADIIVDRERIRPPGSEVDCLLSDPSRVRALTGWTHRQELEGGIAETAAWLERNLGLYRPGQYTV